LRIIANKGRFVLLSGMPISFRLKVEAVNQVRGYLNADKKHYAGAAHDFASLHS
jgi:hypothetical protein